MSKTKDSDNGREVSIDKFYKKQFDSIPNDHYDMIRLDLLSKLEDLYHIPESVHEQTKALDLPKLYQIHEAALKKDHKYLQDNYHLKLKDEHHPQKNKH